METDNKMDFLDITTSNNRSRLEISIFLKPNTTDNTVLWHIIAVILQNIKQATNRYFAARMNEYLWEMQRDKDNITVWTTAMICYLNVHLRWPRGCNSHIQGGAEPTDTFRIWILRRRDSLSWLAWRGMVEERTPFHMVWNSMAVVREMFGTVISRFGDIAWPARSPELTVPDFFLWGFL